MTSSIELLPLREVLEPEDQPQLVEIVAEAAGRGTPIYPLGGETSLNYGLAPREEGIGVSLKKLDRVVDYPARDMTVTVEAGVTMRRLAELLAAERQQFPVDAPRAEVATLGGVVATNFNGPRCFGMGGIRDFVIGISAVDGRGTAFKGGGRVVKNVAGYDFCKLLTGSLGTLAVISQLTLKLRPLPEKRAVVSTGADDLDHAERILAALVHSQTRPVGVELLVGPEWREQGSPDSAANSTSCGLAILLEGTTVEVDWMVEQLNREWQDERRAVEIAEDEAVDVCIGRFVEFPTCGDSPLVLKASLAPSGVTPFAAAVLEVDSEASLLAHAGNGIVFAKFSQFPAEGLARTLIARLQPVAAANSGHVVILSNPGGGEMTHQSVWGGEAPFDLMTSVKRQFDPRNLLNPGRFVYLSE